VTLSRAKLAKMIDHAALAADTSREDIETACRVARECGVASVCVMPHWTGLCAKLLADSETVVGVAVGFPLGSHLIACKALEARLVIERGAREIDFVMNVGAAKSGDWETVEMDAREMVESVRSMEEEKGEKVPCKMILECCYLTDEEKRRACEVAVRVGADFVKTSTGFGSGGATVEDVRLMREVVGPAMGIKAAGGIRTRADALALIEAGATRIGTRSTIALLTEE
jgi:deoxyribose-phosphate aldolase